MRSDWDVSPGIPFIKVLYYVETDEGQDTERRYYGMDYYWHIICDEDPSLVGLQYIRIELIANQLSLPEPIFQNIIIVGKCGVRDFNAKRIFSRQCARIDR